MGNSKLATDPFSRLTSDLMSISLLSWNFIGPWKTDKLNPYYQFDSLVVPRVKGQGFVSSSNRRFHHGNMPVWKCHCTHIQQLWLVEKWFLGFLRIWVLVWKVKKHLLNYWSTRQHSSDDLMFLKNYRFQLFWSFFLAKCEIVTLKMVK